MGGEFSVLLMLTATTLGLVCGLGALLIDSQFQAMGMILGLALSVPTAQAWQRRRRNAL